MDETFFAECEKELTKINLFFSQKIAESQGKYHELNVELNTFKESIESRQTPVAQRKNVRLRFAGAKLVSANKLQKEQSKTAQQLKLAFRFFFDPLILLIIVISQ
jgi:DNA invertase Pin-like site-specific DNA recombinase